MDPTLMASLLKALEASPGNLVLLTAILETCFENDDLPGAENALTISQQVPATLSGATRWRFAQLAVEHHANERALFLLGDDQSGQALVIRARGLLALGRREEAGVAFAEAVARNATVYDARLASELSGKIVSIGAPKPRAIASISNDDTSTDDVVRVLQPAFERVAFADVGGLDAVKQQIRRRIITPFLKPSLFERFKRRSGGGILMYGPPGCGKTLLARATAGECGARFFNVAITDVLDMYIGESERKLHALFENARRAAPAVLFFDEIEAIGGKRQHSREATSAKLVSQFLTELDGFAQNNQGVLILGATNVPWAVDPAFRRPGRFDRVLFVPPPDLSARKQILDRLLADRPTAGDLGIDGLARRCSGFSGADLRNLVETAVDEAIEASLRDGREQPLTAQHLHAALAQTRPTTLEWLTTARNHARYANEAGQYDEVLEFLKQNGGAR